MSSLLNLVTWLFQTVVIASAEHRFSRTGFVLACSLTVLLSSQVAAQEVTRQQQRKIADVEKQITKAGDAFKDEKLDRSTALIKRAQSSLESLYEKATPELVELIKPQHERLAKAHQLLVKSGKKLKELQPLPDGIGGFGEVSFVQHVAPILIAKCGNCHVNRSRGQFSAATYEALIASTTVTDGMADKSRLIEVIESGDMPKGGLTIEADELAVLKKWINAGAKFDGAQPSQDLPDLVGAMSPGNDADIAINKPTGDETVSFGLNVAPVLLEHCGECHITRNPRGNLNMAMYRTFVRGGDSGAVIKPGDSAGSNLIMRLRGTGGAEVMPPRGKLDDAVVNDIAKWIDEGAKFDPGDVALAMSAVAAKAKAASLTHDELVVQRRAQSNKVWKLAMTDIEPTTANLDNFYVMGTTNESKLTDVGLFADKTSQDVAKFLKTTAEPFIKGNGTIYVFERRYDFSEFGKMVERVEFPQGLKSHWKHDTTNAYASLILTKDKSAEDVQVSITHQVAALHVADMSSSIPRWFSDGVGLLVASRLHSSEPGVKGLDAAAMNAVTAMKNADDFMKNKMAEDQAGLVSYLFVKDLRSDAGRFRKLMKQLESGTDFESAFRKVYGATPIEAFGNYNKNW